MSGKYVISTESISEAKNADTKGANAVLFINRGEADAYVNGEKILTDQWVGNSGLKDEIDETLYRVTFVNTGGQTQLVYMRIKKYV